ncbi:MAG TPA: DUF2249 domain-containing protein [Rhodocyclaceae bacterium]|nr:DUF2249 domain-containing protein [Zoogloeaceae bacterium]HRD35637.1 DUF2249 domain-containing protein [Rhodocyclaceae bacterium]
MSDGVPIMIDARRMQPPEPMERVLDALDLLEVGNEIHLVINREPVPLYNVLKRNGYTHVTQRDADDTFLVRIMHAARKDAAPKG